MVMYIFYSILEEMSQKGGILMNLRFLVGPFGMLTGIAFGIAILNFFIKYINKIYINKLSNDKKDLKQTYRSIMKPIVKYHKIAGILAIVFLAIHFYATFSNGRIKFNGVIAGIIMLIVVSLGIYGFKISKNKRGSWLKLHRVLAFVLLFAIVFHVL